DGSIVFCSDRSGGETDIWVMNSDGTDPVNLTDDPSSFDCAPNVIPASGSAAEKLSFVSDRADGNLSIYTMNTDGSEVWRLTVDPADDFDSSADGNGVTLVFDRYADGNWDLYTISME